MPTIEDTLILCVAFLCLLILFLQLGLFVFLYTGKFGKRQEGPIEQIGLKRDSIFGTFEITPDPLSHVIEDSTWLP
ncbi:unnamed protein product [Caenorhabditis nigoni]